MGNTVLSGFFQPFMTARRQKGVENSAIFVIFVYKRQILKLFQLTAPSYFDADLFYSPLIPLLPGT